MDFNGKYLWPLTPLPKGRNDANGIVMVTVCAETSGPPTALSPRSDPCKFPSFPEELANGEHILISRKYNLTAIPTFFAYSSKAPEEENSP